MKVYEYDGEIFDEAGIEDKIADDFESMIDENYTLRGFLENLPDDLYDSIKERYLNDESLYNQMGIVVKTVNQGTYHQKPDEPIEQKDELQDSIRRIILRYEPVDVAGLVEGYFTSLKYKKFDGRKKDNSCTFRIRKETGNRTINKIECSIFDSEGREELFLAFRKYGGEYIIIGKNNTQRLVEVDSQAQTWSYDKTELTTLLKNYQPLFQDMGVKV